MMMMDDKHVFIGINVLVHATIEISPFRESSQKALKQFINNGYAIWISRQVIREYLVVKSRLMSDNKCYDENQLLIELNYLQANFKIADEENNTTIILSELIKKYKIAGKQIHDDSLITTCLDKKIGCLLTNNIAHFKQFASEGTSLIPIVAESL